MVLTDHNTTSSYEEFRALVDPRTLVIPGAELTTYNGHCLAIGVEDWMDWRTGLAGRSINDVARAVRAAGGIFVVAHPDAMPDEVCTGCRWTHDDFDPALADAVEIWGGLWDGPEEENEGCVALWQRWLEPRPPAGRHRRHRRAPPEGLGGGGAAHLRARGRALAGGDPRRPPRGAHVRQQRPRAVSRARAGRCGGALRGRPAGAEMRVIADDALVASARVSGGVGRLHVPPPRAWAYAELWNGSGNLMLAATSPVYAEVER